MDDKECRLPLKTKAQATAFAAKHGLKYDSRKNEFERTYKFDRREDVERFVFLVFWLSDKLWHHPTITVGWDCVKLSLNTHDSGGITEKDFEFFTELEILHK